MVCERCGGLKIADHFYGAEDSCGIWSYTGLRCVNCGAISVQPLISPTEASVARSPACQPHVSQ